MPVGSIPYLTRSGFPVFTLRANFCCSSASGTICSAPRQIKANCSSTVFTALAFSARLLVHLKAPDRFEGIAVMVDRRFFPIRWPTQEEHIETGGMIQQAVLLKKVQRQVGQTALFGK